MNWLRDGAGGRTTSYQPQLELIINVKQQKRELGLI